MQKQFIEETWKIKYQNFLLQTIEEEDLDIQMQVGIKLFELIADFKVKAASHVINIIDELSLPPCLRKDMPKKINFPPNMKVGNKMMPCELIYQKNTYEIKIGIPSTAECYGLLEDG